MTEKYSRDTVTQTNEWSFKKKKKGPKSKILFHITRPFVFIPPLFSSLTSKLHKAPLIHDQIVISLHSLFFLSPEHDTLRHACSNTLSSA